MNFAITYIPYSVLKQNKSDSFALSVARLLFINSGLFTIFTDTILRYIDFL